MTFEDRENEWRRINNTPGGIAVCEIPLWLINGCPSCGGKCWTVTSDSWAYCEACGAGYPTIYPFTHRYIAYLDETGKMSCGLCHGTGVFYDKPCRDCQ